MKLLRRSLGRGSEGCKAACAFARLAGAARCGDRHPDSGRPTVHTRHGPDHSVDPGLGIAEAATPDQAVDLAHRDPPRAVLLDVNFDDDRGPTGFDVCKLLKEDPATKAIPVVMLTARDSASDRKAGLAAGASHYLIKPFGPIDLINTLSG